MRVKVHGPLALEDLDESFHPEVARRKLRRVAARLCYLVAIFLCFYELIANKGSGFCTRSWKGAAARTDRIRTVRELYAAHVMSVLVVDQKVFDLVGVIAEL